jgi:hypothetical protein
MSKIQPQRLAFYKGVGGKFGAVQFNLQKPHYFCPKCKRKDFESVLPQACPSGCELTAGKMESREGCIFMEITSASAPNKYDWERKILFALSTNDMGQILFGLETGEEVKLMHDPGAKSDKQGEVSKNLHISSPKGIKAGCLVSMSQKKNDDEEVIRHTVPLSGPEAKTLSVFLRAAITASLAWD